MDRFYNDLVPFDIFGECAELGAYEPVPDGWHVAIADIRGSTKAIEAGRYKDVNMMGAAAIAAVLNISGDIEVPFVFGGDGGTVLVPASLRDAAADALARLRGLSESAFGLEMRTGTVPVADVRENGLDIRIRKFRLSPGNHLAMFTGGGMETADALLKGEPPDPRYVPAASGDPPGPDLEGLSCRWETLTPRGGTILTLMVRGVEADAEAQSAVLRETLAGLADILGEIPRNAAPAGRHSMRFRWPPRGLGLEARATAAGRGIARRHMEIWAQSFLQWICHRFHLRMGEYDAPVYSEELCSNTDFRKYDDTLRMVLDVTPGQADAIERRLETEYAAGRLLYGTHRAGAALMTCLVFSIARSGHIHFIDGADGGFALAAAGFKKRRAAAVTDGQNDMTDGIDCAGPDILNLPDDFVANACGYYAALRERSPVHRNSGGSFMLIRHDDLAAVDRGPPVRSSDKTIGFRPEFGGSPLYEHHTAGLAFRDPPDHTRIRKLFQAGFRGRRGPCRPCRTVCPRKNRRSGEVLPRLRPEGC